MQCMGNLGCFPRGKRAAITDKPVFFSLFLFSCVQCFRNPPNSDMDYRIFNVCTWSFLCVRIHMGVRHTTTMSQHSILNRKNTIFSWAPDGVRTFGSRVDALPTEPPHHLSFIILKVTRAHSYTHMDHHLTPHQVSTQKTVSSGTICRNFVN